MRIFVYVQQCVKLCGWVRFLKRRRARRCRRMPEQDARERCSGKMPEQDARECGRTAERAQEGTHENP